ncbi:MAG: hypothetical protein ABIQ31_05775 [Ferruginibacter sp.]
MNVILQTTFTPYHGNELINPQGSLLNIHVNAGATPDGLLVNGIPLSDNVLSNPNNFFLKSLFLQMQVLKNAIEGNQKIEIINETQFQVGLYGRAIPGFQYGTTTNSSVIIVTQTTVKIEK